MDRHQFVGTMIKKRNEKNEELTAARKRKSKAYDRSATKLNSFLEKAKKSKNTYESGSVQLVDGYSIIDYYSAVEPALEESARVTDEDIMALCGDIRDIENEIKATLEEAERLEREDVSAMIKEAIELD